MQTWPCGSAKARSRRAWERLTGFLPSGSLLWKNRINPKGWRNLPMIKSELVQKIAECNPHLYQRDVENIVNAILDTITDALAHGDRVELRGFGAFSVKKRDARTGRNPRTGETVSVSEKVIPVFKTGKEMRGRLNRDRGDDANFHEAPSRMA